MTAPGQRNVLPTTRMLRWYGVFCPARSGTDGAEVMTALQNWYSEVRQSMNSFPLISTSPQAPDSYQFEASPAKSIAEPETWSNTFPLTVTRPGVVKSAALALLLRTVLDEKSTDGCQSAFSTASPSAYLASAALPASSRVRSTSLSL